MAGGRSGTVRREARMARILAIDDDEAIRTLLRDVLTREGHEVLLARNGVEALKAFTADPCELVITDIIMPDKEGIETIVELRRHDPQVPIIALSGAGTGGFDYLRFAKKLGATHTLAKPVRISDLRQIVAECLAPADGLRAAN
jgi:DNA-binding NtrC family response regulator